VTASGGARWRGALAYGAAGGLILCAVVWVVRNAEKVSGALSLRPMHLALLVPLVILSPPVMGLVNQILAAHLGAPLRFRQWLALSFASTLANYVLPMRAGAALRAGYFKRVGNLPVTKFASMMAVAYVLTLGVNSALGLAALGSFYLEKHLVSWPLLATFLVMLCACLVVVALPSRARQAEPPAGLRGVVARVHAGWHLLRKSPALLAKVAGLSLASTALYVARLYVAFAAVGHPVSLSGCMLVAALAALSTFLAVTPGGLGVREAAILYSSLAVGVAPEVSLLAAAMDRAAAVAVVLVLGALATVSISRDAAEDPARAS